MTESHFDGVLADDSRSPSGFMKVTGVTDVLINPNTGRVVITGRPNETHHCNQRGCGSVEHKIAEFDVDVDFAPIRLYTESQD